MDAEELFLSAKHYHRAGQLSEAERLYREVLRLQSDHAEALFFMSILALQVGKLGDAEELLEKATKVVPDHPVYLTNLSDVYRRVGKSEQAVFSLGLAIASSPDVFQPYFNLGVILEECGELDGAEVCLARAVELEPNQPPIRERLAVVQRKHVGGSVAKQGTAARNMSFVVATALRSRARFYDAAQWYRFALGVTPHLAVVHAGLGIVLLAQNYLDEGIASLERAIELDASTAEACEFLGNAYCELGRIQEGIALCRRAVSRAPEMTNWHSALLFNLSFDPECAPRALLQEARAFDERHAKPLSHSIGVHRNDWRSNRKLRVGYVSPDFGLTLSKSFHHSASLQSRPRKR